VKKCLKCDLDALYPIEACGRELILTTQNSEPVGAWIE
jgi:hypothetical protein